MSARILTTSGETLAQAGLCTIGWFLGLGEFFDADTLRGHRVSRAVFLLNYGRREGTDFLMFWMESMRKESESRAHNTSQMEFRMGTQGRDGNGRGNWAMG